jgi:hypothetical protein
MRMRFEEGKIETNGPLDVWLRLHDVAASSGEQDAIGNMEQVSEVNFL